MDELIEQELALISCIGDAETESEQELFIEMHEALGETL